MPLNRRTFVVGMQTVTFLPGSFLPLYGHAQESLTRPNGRLSAAGVQFQLDTGTYVVHAFGNVGRAFSDGDALIKADGTLAGAGFDLSSRTPIGPLMLSLGTDAIDRFPDVGVRVGYIF